MAQDLSNGLTKGIDVSKHQGTIDWEKVKKSGVKFAMIHEGYGIELKKQKDELFETNYKRAKGYGIKVGAYHYSYAKSTKEAVQEAKFCLKNIAGKQFEYPIAFDIEDSYLSGISVVLETDICRAFCETIENAGYYAMIYCNLDWYKNHINGAELAKKYDIWLAQWRSSCPSVPCGIWQYSDCATVSGILKKCDTDFAYKNYPEIMKTKGLNGFSKTSGSTQTENVQKYFEYTVQKGDTLWELAEKYLDDSSRYREIQGLNGLSNDTIYAGQTLKIPKN